MVGRSRELGRLRSLLDDACAGNAGLCSVPVRPASERLASLRSFAASARASGIAVAWTRATDRGSSAPYGLWNLLLYQLPASPAPSSTSGRTRSARGRTPSPTVRRPPARHGSSSSPSRAGSRGDGHHRVRHLRGGFALRALTPLRCGAGPGRLDGRLGSASRRWRAVRCPGPATTLDRLASATAGRSSPPSASANRTERLAAGHR